MSAASESSASAPGAESTASGSRKVGLSCAECRRSKLKCDRAFPCQSCVRRGCSAICPNGTLAATKGNKVLMAHAQRLTDQVKTMAEKIKQLEQALADAEERPDSTKQAPTLGESSRVSDGSHDIHALFDAEGHIHEATDALGSLSIGQFGQVRYHGESAGSEYFQQLLTPSNNSRPASTSPRDLDLPAEITELCNAYPFGLRENLYTKYIFLPYIPARELALHLAGLHYEKVAWMCNPIVRNDFMSGIVDILYGQSGHPNLDRVHSHTLSVFFILLALGALFDSEPSAMRTAELYSALARAALCLDSIFNEATCSTVQALLLITRFIYEQDRPNNEERWLLTGLCVRVGQIIGLQRDSAGWSLDPEEVQRRRVLFWELFSFDAWSSIVIGRPPALSINHIDCKFPEDKDVVITPSGNVEMGWYNWKFRYAASCMSACVSHAFNTRQPTYPMVLELDRKIRNVVVPSHLQATPGALGVGCVWSTDSAKAMQQYGALFLRESNLLHLHRGYFAQAIKEAPDDPLKHKFSPSVTAAYYSSRKLVSNLKSLYTVHPDPVGGQQWFWSSFFSSCVVLGALAAETPRCPYAQDASKELDDALSLYEQVPEARRSSMTLTALQKLRHRVTAAMVAVQAGSPPPRGSHSPSLPDELDVLKGRKSIFANPSPSNSPPMRGSPYLYTTLSHSSEEFTEQFVLAPQPPLMNYLGPQFDPENSGSSAHYTSGANASDHFGGGFTFFNPNVGSQTLSLPEYITHPASVDPSRSGQLGISARNPQRQQFHQLQRPITVPDTTVEQSQNREEVWRQFVHHLNMNRDT
ncbi:fungal-specific transcription factor domain-containing protein [Pisolithus croceorrhizus]|nr:fungal-specific transcription factor domain-containing protein [Pisolithus croceorrhizus]